MIHNQKVELAKVILEAYKDVDREVLEESEVTLLDVSATYLKNFLEAK